MVVVFRVLIKNRRIFLMNKVVLYDKIKWYYLGSCKRI